MPHEILGPVAPPPPPPHPKRSGVPPPGDGMGPRGQTHMNTLRLKCETSTYCNQCHSCMMYFGV